MNTGITGLLIAALLLLPAPAFATPACVVSAARQQIGVTVHYDPRYVALAYPNGDVPADRGVCTDVVVRAFRAAGIDLQQRVHDDMRQHFSRYPKNWGLRAPDRNIDHRRVPNLQTFFARHGQSFRPGAQAVEPGDLLTFMLPGNLPHIGIVSDRRVDGKPLLIHNIGAGTQEESVVDAYPRTGHYRYRPRDPAPSCATGAK
jgi:uncharacterized protein